MVKIGLSIIASISRISLDQTLNKGFSNQTGRMSSMSRNYKVYVSAIPFRTAWNNRTPSLNSEFSIRVKVATSYASGATVTNQRSGFNAWELLHRARSVPRKLNDFCTEKRILFSRHDLTRDFVSKMISDMNIPFSLDHLQWRGNPKEDWIPLSNKDDIISSVFHVATATSTSAAADSQNLYLSVIINRETILPPQELEAMDNERRAQEQAQEIQEAISWVNQLPTGSGEANSLAANWIVQALRDQMGADFGQNSSLRSLIKRAMRESAEQAEGSKPIPATKLSIEALEEVIIESTESCSICMENMAMASAVSRMPCSHRFHKTCIETWLGRNHMCPLCRLKLPTTWTS